MSFFIESKSDTAIFLVDASGSTKLSFVGNKTVFDKMADVMIDLNYKNNRIIFWNSDTTGVFDKGIEIIPFIVKKENIKLLFARTMTKITGRCLTFPHLGFQNIKPEWLKDDPQIYLFTDGQITCYNSIGNPQDITKMQLSSEIKKINQLSIVSIDKTTNDLYDAEHMANAVGNDIYKIVVDNNLTGIVTNFTSYSPQKTYVHINKIKPPAGYLPYTNKYFSEKNIRDFIVYVGNEINNAASDTECMIIAQNLATTLYYLTKDCSPALAQSRIRIFSTLFNGRLDAEFINYILTEAIENERVGKAQIIADYKKNLKNLYAQSQTALLKNTKTAIGFGDQFISLPYPVRHEDNSYMMLRGSSRLINEKLTLKKQTFNNCAAFGVPALPIEYSNEQCVRQWVRQVIGLRYGVDPLSDLALYLFLVITWIVNKSVVDKSVIDIFVKLAMTMLRKKRPNSIETELDRMERGELPTTSSGTYADFLKTLERAIQFTGLQTTPEELWYNISKLFKFDAQLKHFNVPNAVDASPVTCLSIIDIPNEVELDYTCILCIEDINKGYAINPHRFIGANECMCHPNFLICVTCIDTFKNSGNCVCPICFAQLSNNSFKNIDTKPDFKLPDIFTKTIQLDMQNAQCARTQRDIQQPNAQHDIQQPDAQDMAAHTIGNLVILRGTVGSGKSTYAKKLAQYLRSNKIPVLIQGPDQYRKNGASAKGANNAIKQAISHFIGKCTNMQKNAQHKNIQHINHKTIIIDTCGEYVDTSNIFGHNLSDWKIHTIYPNWNEADPEGYYMWSLRNILNRHAPGKNDNYWLNPTNIGANECRKIHKNKFKNVFMMDTYSQDNFNKADEYIKSLQEPEFVLHQFTAV